MASDIEYLQQIAQDNRGVAASTGSGGFFEAFDPKWIKLLIGAVIAVVLMAVLGGFLANLGNREQDLLDQIYARTNNLSEAVTGYVENVKSSELRAMGRSLATVLVDTNTKVAGLLTSEYGVENVATPRSEETTTTEEEHIAEVNTSLEYGRLNGLMDRYFLLEMKKEIVLLQSLESDTLERSSAEAVRTAMAQAWNNLELLREQYEEYENIVN